MNNILAADPKGRQEIKQVASLFGAIGNHQRALQDKDESQEDEMIRQLTNNKVKVKKDKKVKKNGNNRKQHNSK